MPRFVGRPRNRFGPSVQERHPSRVPSHDEKLGAHADELTKLAEKAAIEYPEAAGKGFPLVYFQALYNLEHDIERRRPFIEQLAAWGFPTVDVVAAERRLLLALSTFSAWADDRLRENPLSLCIDDSLYVPPPATWLE